MKTSQKPGYEAHKNRMRARHRAFHRLAAIHRADFLRLLHEEQQAIDAAAVRMPPTRAAARLIPATPPRRPARKRGTPMTDPGWIDAPFSAPPEWLAELAREAS